MTRERGSALILAAVFAVVFAGFALAAVTVATGESSASVETIQRTEAEAGAMSALNYGITKVRRGGIRTLQQSGTFGRAATNIDVATSGNLVTVRARGTVGQAPHQVTAYARAILHGRRFIPPGPLYYGNGAIEFPSGNPEGYAPSSWISDALELKISTWNHPPDFLASPIATPPQGDPRWYEQDTASTLYGQPFVVFSSQNDKGTQNASLFLAPWTTGSTTFDPMTKVERVTDAGYQPVQVAIGAPDVQTFAYDLWATKQAGDLVLTQNDVLTGNYTSSASSTTDARGLGTLAEPRVVFVTGQLENTLKDFKGAGILVIRDDWDPAVGGDRLVGSPKKGSAEIRNTFEWTGLVIVAGWGPNISTRNLPAGLKASINGALIGEDSVQSSSEASLDDATICFRIGPAAGSSVATGRFELFFSKDVFGETLPNGSSNPIWQRLPVVDKRVVCVDSSVGAVPSWPLPAGW